MWYNKKDEEPKELVFEVKADMVVYECGAVRFHGGQPALLQDAAGPFYGKSRRSRPE
jgi:hypothetical protein